VEMHEQSNRELQQRLADLQAQKQKNAQVGGCAEGAAACCAARWSCRCRVELAGTAAVGLSLAHDLG
jgi:hypothetical protein